MSDHQDLLARAQERAESKPIPAEWGSYRIQLDPQDSFIGRWRGRATDEANDRPIYLLWDENDQPCWVRAYTALTRELDRAAPAVGDRVVIYRGEDYPTQYGNPGQSYGVETQANAEPVPGDVPAAVVEGSTDDGIPF